MISTTAPPRAATKMTSGIAFFAGAVGLTLGVLTNLLQGWLPYPWDHLANSGAVWSVAAFAVGAVLAVRIGNRWWLAIGGALTEIGLVVGYYGYAEFGRDGMGSLFFPLVWTVMACVAGPLFALAGAEWRAGTHPWRRAIALGALGGLFGSEAMQMGLVVGYPGPALVLAAVTCALPILMARTMKERWRSLAMAAIASLVAYALIYLPLNLLSA
ncbi:DUF6518 family protein [Streptomyces sp. 058-1L]|uniref:DUF6518 family protein n=1 Tax=Streptomyces sp. 058-1L TaxID=2789266 RepID=UPI0039815528